MTAFFPCVRCAGSIYCNLRLLRDLTVFNLDSFPTHTMSICFLSSSLLLALSLLVGTLLISGCRSSGEPADAQPSALPANLSPAEAVEVIERDLRQQGHANVRVGYVETVSNARVAIIADLDTSGLAEGDPFMFFDTAGDPVAFGQIISVDVNEVTGEFQPDFVQNGRRVRQGDFAAFNLGQQ